MSRVTIVDVVIALLLGVITLVVLDQIDGVDDPLPLLGGLLVFVLALVAPPRRHLS